MPYHTNSIKMKVYSFFYFFLKTFGLQIVYETVGQSDGIYNYDLKRFYKKIK